MIRGLCSVISSSVDVKQSVETPVAHTMRCQFVLRRNNKRDRQLNVRTSLGDKAAGFFEKNVYKCIYTKKWQTTEHSAVNDRLPSCTLTLIHLQCANYRHCYEKCKRMKKWIILLWQCESKKIPPWRVLTFFIFSQTVSPILTKLCHIKRDYPVHIICSKCSPSAEMHALTHLRKSL